MEPTPIPNNVIVLGYADCFYCNLAKTLLILKQIPFEFRDIKLDETALAEWKSLGVTTVPQIFFDGRLIGGYTDMAKVLS